MATLKMFLSDLGTVVLSLAACCSCAHPEVVAEALTRAGGKGAEVEPKGTLGQSGETHRVRAEFWM